MTIRRIPFDQLQFMRTLKDSGIESNQAEAITRALTTAISQTLEKIHENYISEKLLSKFTDILFPSLNRWELKSILSRMRDE